MTEDTVDGFVVIRDGSIVGLSGLLSQPIEGGSGVLEINLRINDATDYDGLMFGSGDRSVLAEWDSGEISVSKGDIVTFHVVQSDTVEPEENSVSLVLLLEQ